MGVFWSIAGLMSTIAFLTLVFGFFLADTHRGRMEVGVFRHRVGGHSLRIRSHRSGVEQTLRSSCTFKV